MSKDLNVKPNRHTKLSKIENESLQAEVIRSVSFILNVAHISLIEVMKNRHHHGYLRKPKHKERAEILKLLLLLDVVLDHIGLVEAQNRIGEIVLHTNKFLFIFVELLNFFLKFMFISRIKVVKFTLTQVCEGVLSLLFANFCLHLISGVFRGMSHAWIVVAVVLRLVGHVIHIIVNWQVHIVKHVFMS